MTYFSRQTDYALQLVSALAKLPVGELTSLKIFSLESNISFLFLQKIAQSLKKAQIIESVRGSQGGYHLAKPASTITVRQILEAVEGQIGATDCKIGGQKECSKLKNCAIQGTMGKINEKMLSFLDQTTLVDF